MLKHTAVGTDQKRQLVRPQRQAFRQRSPLALRRSVEHGVRIAVSREEALETDEVGRCWTADQDRSGARFDQADAAQDEGAHDEFAEIGRSDDECAYMRGVEGQSRATLRPGSSGGDRGPTAEQADLARELAGPERRDGALVAEPIAANGLDRAIENEPCRRVPIARSEGHLSWCEASWSPAGKAPRRVDLSLGELGEHLRAARLDEAHHFPPWPSNKSDDVPAAKRS